MLLVSQLTFPADEDLLGDGNSINRNRVQLGLAKESLGQVQIQKNNLLDL